MKETSVREDLQKHYGDYYRSADLEWRRLGAADKAFNIVSLCRSLPHDSILEIGAGDGAILERLAALDFGRDYRALEISPSAVEVVKAKGVPRLVDCRVFDGYQLPYADRSLDLAVLSHVLEHVEYPRRLLYEASRVARHVFVEVPLEDTSRLASDFVLDDTGHINDYSARSIRRLVQSCGLTVTAQEIAVPSKAVHRFAAKGSGVVAYYVKKAALAVWGRAATRLFTYHSALVCHR